MIEQESSPRPTWMNDDFLKTCIRNSNHLPRTATVQIEGVLVKYAVPKGENYASVIYRALVEYRMADEETSSDIRKESFVFKVSHEEPAMALIGASLFDRETNMLENVIPEIHNLLEKYNLKTTIGCRCLNAITEGCPRVLALEDLVEQGYRLASRQKGLDYNHVKVVLSKLAKFHAGSKITFELMDEQQKNSVLNHPVFKEQGDTEEMKMFSENSSKSAKNIATDLSKFGDKYSRTINFLKQYAECTLEVWNEMAPLIPGSKFNAICHTDCWVNNMMFRYSGDGSVEDVIFVDLQSSYYASVASDFVYFFVSSTDAQVRMSQFDEAKKFYLDSFNSTLKQLGYSGDLPTEEEFDEELKRCVLVAAMAMTAVLPLILKEFDSKTQSREEVKSFSLNEVFVMMSQGGAKSSDVIRSTVDVLQKRGFFDKFPDISKKERAMGL